MARTTITFDESAIDFVAGAFGKTFDEEGVMVEKSDPKQHVLTRHGDEILKSEFRGVCKGSTLFLKDDIASLIDAAECGR